MVAPKVIVPGTDLTPRKRRPGRRPRPWLDESKSVPRLTSAAQPYSMFRSIWLTNLSVVITAKRRAAVRRAGTAAVAIRTTNQTAGSSIAKVDPLAR
jgi:hypothetical protein